MSGATPVSHVIITIFPLLLMEPVTSGVGPITTKQPSTSVRVNPPSTESTSLRRLVLLEPTIAITITDLLGWLEVKLAIE